MRDQGGILVRMLSTPGAGPLHSPNAELFCGHRRNPEGCTQNTARTGIPRLPLSEGNRSLTCIFLPRRENYITAKKDLQPRILSVIVRLQRTSENQPPLILFAKAFMFESRNKELNGRSRLPRPFLRLCALSPYSATDCRSRNTYSFLLKGTRIAFY
jgi:hypothetical protein